MAGQPQGPRDADRLFDLRTVERNIRKGLITRKDVDKHLKGLQDRGDNVQRIDPAVTDDR